MILYGNPDGRRQPPRGPLGSTRWSMASSGILSRGTIPRACAAIAVISMTKSARNSPFRRRSMPGTPPVSSRRGTAWELAGRRGIIALPTGAGKTRTAIAAIARTGAPDIVSRSDARAHGAVGQDARRSHPRTDRRVWRRTPDRAAHHRGHFCQRAPQRGDLRNRFDLLVIDEVHHFGSGAGDEALEMCTAAARLGLSATLPEDEVRRARLESSSVPKCTGQAWRNLPDATSQRSSWSRSPIGLTPSERQAYDAEMSVFRPVCRTFFETAPGASWSDFVAAAGRSDAGRRALAAWRRSRAIVRYTSEKRRVVNDLLLRHRDARILVFAADNDTAYAVAREHLVQPITCDIGAKRAGASASTLLQRRSCESW